MCARQYSTGIFFDHIEVLILHGYKHMISGGTQGMNMQGVPDTAGEEKAGIKL